jgi:hypothetical protein
MGDSSFQEHRGPHAYATPRPSLSVSRARVAQGALVPAGIVARERLVADAIAATRDAGGESDRFPLLGRHALRDRNGERLSEY